MKLLNFLKKGDTVAIIAPAGKVVPEKVENMKKVLESWGLIVKTGKNIFKKNNSFAGTDEERLADFQQMLDDKNVKAIFSARGGYGCVRFAEKLNLGAFIKNPKWIVGYSDVTVLHSLVQIKTGVPTIHGIMSGNFIEGKNELTESFRKCLFGEPQQYKIKPDKLNRPGKATGTLVGGNLSVLYSLRGTPLDIDTTGKILFIEDLGEYDYHIDRMIRNFKSGGKFDKLKGLVLGSFSKIKKGSTPFGKTAYEIIQDAVKDYDFPVIYGFPAGHIKNNYSFYLGRKTVMEVKDSSVMLNFG